MEPGSPLIVTVLVDVIVVVAAVGVFGVDAVVVVTVVVVVAGATGFIAAGAALGAAAVFAGTVVVVETVVVVVTVAAGVVAGVAPVAATTEPVTALVLASVVETDDESVPVSSVLVVSADALLSVLELAVSAAGATEVALPASAAASSAAGSSFLLQAETINSAANRTTPNFLSTVFTVVMGVSFTAS